MFDAIAPVGTFRDALATLLTTVDETVFHLREEELYAQPTDPGKVGTVNLWLDADSFESYEADGGKLGLNIARLDEYLSKADADELAHIRLDPETRMLEVETDTADFQMAAIDPDAIRNGVSIEETGALEQMTLDVTLDGSALSHAVDVCAMVSDHLIIDGDPDRDDPVRFVGEGDTDTATVSFEKSLHEGSTVPEPIESLYSIDYLEDLVSAIPSDAAVRLRSHDEWPLAVDYDAADGCMTVQMALAPRVQSR